MRKSRIVIILSVLCVLALIATGLFACGNTEPIVDPSEGRVVAVGSAMDTVYAAMLAQDGSVGSNYFTLKTSGSYTYDDKIYDVAFSGTFDITQSGDDDLANNRSQLLLEVKQGGIEVFLLYYSAGKLYLHFPPYARRGMISDYRLDEAVRRIVSEKNSGVIKRAADTIPTIAESIFTECRCYTAEDKSDRYVFTLSYTKLFETFASIVDSWDAGFSAAELLSALHLTEAERASLSANAGATTLSFVVKEGAFISAKAEKAEGGSIVMDTFALTRGLVEIELPTALSTFSEFDFRNFAISGTMELRASGKGDRAVNYDVTVSRDYEGVTYPFDYDFASHYVAGQGWEFALSLKDKNGKASAFTIRNGYLYLDLTAYGVQKCKISTEELSSRLGTTGFKEVGTYDFRDRLHLLVLLAAARSEEGETVKYTLGKEVFDLIGEKVGFKGLFGISGAEISWNTANDRLQNFAATLTVGGMTASLSAQSFVFGTPTALADVTDADYVDLTTKETTHFAISGTIRQTTVFGSEGAMLSTLLASLSGKDFNTDTYLKYDVSGAIGYTAHFVYGKTGALKTVFMRLFRPNGSEILTLYYTGDTSDVFYLITPEESGSGVRRAYTLTLANEPLAAFNAALGVGEASPLRKIYLGAKADEFMFGVHSSMLGVIAEKVALIYPDFSLPYLSALNCRRYEVRVSDGTITAGAILGDDNEVTVTATKFDVTYGDDVAITSMTPVDLPTLIPLLADNNMPSEAIVTFPGLTYKVSLLDEAGDKIWRYTGTPDKMGRAGQIEEVAASATILGKDLNVILRVDMTPPATPDDVVLGGSIICKDAFDKEIAFSSSDRYDVLTRTFTMNYYNDPTPQTLFDSVTSLLVNINGVEYAKTITWNTSRATSAFGATENNTDVVVDPIVKSYFGTDINLSNLGDAFKFKLHVDGTIADAVVYVEGTDVTDYSMKFVAYDGRDPLDPAVYSDVLNVRTLDGVLVEVRRVEWVLNDPTVISKKNNNALYAYSTSETQQSFMTVRIYDSRGGYVPKDIPVYFEAREVKTVSFAGLPGVIYDGVTALYSFNDLPGVSYSATRGFIFDVLKVRGLDSARTDGVLPQTFIANAGDSDEWTVTGIKWSFEDVSGVLNASGKDGELTLSIGDDISGYQEKTFPYHFTALNVTATELMVDEDTAIEGSYWKTASTYSYTAEKLNAYTYKFPAYVRVSYTTSEGNGSEVLRMDWRYDKPFNEDELCDGGTYTLEGAVGSETLTVTLSFDRKIISNYHFTEDDEEATVTAEGVPLTKLSAHGVTITGDVNKKCLTFSALDALSEDGLKYHDKANYPTTLKVAFGGAEYIDVAVEWDLSPLLERTSILESGALVAVNAIAKGQSFEVYVYVEQAFDDVYTDSALTKKSLTFSLLKAGDLLPDLEHHALVVTDPRDVKNYPTELYIGVDKTVTVLEWIGLDEVSSLYAQYYDEFFAPNKISGTIYVKAKIGDPAIGYKEITVPVYIEEREMGSLSVSGLPFAASSEMTGGATPYAITSKAVDMTLNGRHCDLALELDPYYVDPTSQTTFPTYLVFELDGKLVRHTAIWDLSKIPADAAAADATVNYLVWAMVDLGLDSIQKVKIPVVATVLKREIADVWIGDSGDKYIDIDGYADAPFGGEIIGNYVYLDVKVQFRNDESGKKDANKYPLKLRYDKSAVNLSYNGGSVNNVSVYVGNESGGYRKIDGYTIRITSAIITKVVTKNGLDDKIFYEATRDPVTGVISYTTPDADSVDINDLPSSVKVTFGFGAGTEKTVSFAKEGVTGQGLVFAWVRSQDKDAYLGIVLRNSSLSESVGAGMRQSVYNTKQNNYSSVKYEHFFDDTSFDDTYRDGVNDAGKITVAGFLEEKGAFISASVIGKEYQVRYITADADDALPLSESAVLDAGDYRLYVSVESHSQYKGKVYKRFTIAKKTLSSANVGLYVGGKYRTESQRTGVYLGKGEDGKYYLSAGIVGYDVTMPLLLARHGSEEFSSLLSVQDVKYSTSGEEVEAYVFDVAVDTTDHFGKNYVMQEGTTLSFKVTEASVTTLNPLQVEIQWVTDHFFIEVKMFGEDVQPDPKNNLTNGYRITYYETESSLEEVVTPVADHTYYYQVECKIPNYESVTTSRTSVSTYSTY